MLKLVKPRSGCGTRFLFALSGRRLVLFVILSALVPLITWSFSSISTESALSLSHFAKLTSLSNQIDSLRHRVELLRVEFRDLTPEKPYLIVNSTANEIRLMQGQAVLRKAICSTGSYILLRTYGDRKWLFKTPRGRFKVNVKLKDPWWYKPDWAYIEEGLPIPSLYSPKRYQPGVLGDFALGFGNGYLIHGTLYKRFLGLPITHGCVRLDDQDMRIVFQTMSHGNRIYIY